MADNENNDLSQVDAIEANDEGDTPKSRPRRHLIDAPSDEAVYDADGNFVEQIFPSGENCF